jgi:hypothetical protein
MRFDILRDKEKIATIREALSSEDRKRTGDRGALVRYTMPSMPQAFPRLSRLLDNSAHRAQFLGIYYYIETKEQSLRRLMPAAEYYKFAFRAIADKQYSLRVGYQRVRGLELRIRDAYKRTRETLARTNQPSFNVTDEVYSLKAEIAGVLFVARGVLDTITSLMHFFYGPNSRQFTSFADFVKFLRKGAKEDSCADPELLQYIESNMQWFRFLRDFRDYVTHHSSIDVAFYEPTEGKLLIVLGESMQATEIVSTALFRVDGFCEFVDAHFARRIDRTSTSGAA